MDAASQDALQVPHRSPLTMPRLYHATTWDRLSAIARNGLCPQHRPRWPSYGYRDVAFVAEGMEAARCWLGKLEDFTEAECPEDDLACRVPVLLRLRRRPGELVEDERGSRDCTDGASYRLPSKAGVCVTPKNLQLWHPRRSRWVPISAWATTSPEDGVRDRDEYGVYLFDAYRDGGYKPPRSLTR